MEEERAERAEERSEERAKEMPLAGDTGVDIPITHTSPLRS